MATQQTTYRFGALGNSGDKSAEERGFPSGKGRKKLFLAEIAFIGPFGTKMPQVRILSPRPNERTLQIAESFFVKSSTDFLIIFANLRKCWKGLLYQAFPAFCVSEDTPHIMAFRSLTWR